MVAALSRHFGDVSILAPDRWASVGAGQRSPNLLAAPLVACGGIIRLSRVGRRRPREGEAPMTHHEHPNVTIAREGFEAFQSGDSAWLNEHMADDIVWHVGGNSKWAGTYEGKAQVLQVFARQAQAMGEMTVDTHDVLANDDHVISIGTAKATAADGSSAEWKFAQIMHIKDGKLTEAWGMAENDAVVDPFLDSLPG